MAPKSTESALNWGSYNTVRNTVNTTNGLANTTTLYSFGSTAHPAAYMCKSLSTGGYNTWYMPATFEMITMFTNMGSSPFATSTDIFIADGYFTSTESSATRAGVQGMVGGYAATTGLKNNAYYVRAVRRTTVA